MSVRPTIIAIDPATRTGWAVGDYGPGAAGLRATGVVDLGVGVHPGDRFVLLSNRVKELLADAPHTRVLAWEGAFHRGGPATRYHHGYVAILLWVAACRGLMTIEAKPSEVKKHATGDGHADKAAMMRFAEAHHHRKFATSDEADAAMIYSFARHRLERGLSRRTA